MNRVLHHTLFCLLCIIHVHKSSSRVECVNKTTNYNTCIIKSMVNELSLRNKTLGAVMNAYELISDAHYFLSGNCNLYYVIQVTDKLF
jgi:hypothetical protein